MSTLTTDPGFARGQVLGVTKSLYDAEAGDGSHLYGVHKVFTDVDPVSGQILSNETVECIAVKNESGGVLSAGSIVAFDTDKTLTCVDGLASATSVRFGVVDEYIGSQGVPANEVFWLVVKGPTKVTKKSGAITIGTKVKISATNGQIDSGSTPLVGIAIDAAATADTSVRVLAQIV